ncbi:hypothetical protein [Calothrix sp. 336/3]|uniref:hypothetical protein n=1 Tax=Calothrix sp. 336/3 TaxID=1337936 RepID=UPI000AE49461|nr:hypothetical protein [Calothrix sp. 336/3]
MVTTENLLSQMREQVLKLYSAEIQLAFEKEVDESKQRDFVNYRESYQNNLHQLEKQDLGQVLAKMQTLEAELSQAIASLNGALQTMNNTVNTLRNIRLVSTIIGRVIKMM